MAKSGIEWIKIKSQVNTKMKYAVVPPQRKQFTQHKIGKHITVLRELGKDADTRVADAHKRLEIIKANKRYQMQLERNRMHGALTSMPHNQQQNLRQYLVSLERDMLALTKKGAPP